MINLDFFPSRRLALYTVWLYVSRSLAVLLSLSLVLMMLNLLSESGKILAIPGNGEAELWRYVGYRFPQLLAFAFPFSFLLGALITFTTLNQNSEVVAMKAAGISAHQLIAPLIAASLLLGGASFVFNEFVVVNGSRQLTAWDPCRPIPASSATSGSPPATTWRGPGSSRGGVRACGSRVSLSTTARTSPFTGSSKPHAPGPSTMAGSSRMCEPTTAP
jgi:lipopolysaccharide export system permease protein